MPLFEKLRADVGWYQIRNALKAYNETGDAVPVSFGAFDAAYRARRQAPPTGLRLRLFEIKTWISLFFHEKIRLKNRRR